MAAAGGKETCMSVGVNIVNVGTRYVEALFVPTSTCVLHRPRSFSLVLGGSPVI